MELNDKIAGGFSVTLKKLHSWGTDFYAIIPNLVVGMIVFLFFMLISYFIRHGVSAYFRRRDRIDLGRLLADFCFWLMLGFGFLVVLTIIVPSLKPVDLLSSLGLGSLAFGFAFKDILQNWLSGLLILLRLPFRRGDQIRVGDAEGTVQRIEPRATMIRTYDGRDMVVPNTMIYTSMVMIHTSHKIRRIEMDFTVGYAYDIRRISGIIQKALKPIHEIVPDPPPQILCWDLGSTSLGVKLRWWINSERAAEIISRARIVQAIKEAFEANDIDPTDPQLIYYQRAANAPDDGEEKTSYNPPPEITVSQSDPEADKPKKDPREETMLPEK